MKNQYFGDINDYRKYGLLRALADGGRIRIAVCWMLTDSDDRSDGHRTQYLDNKDRYRPIDPELFYALHNAVVEKRLRDVLVAKTKNIICSAVYYSEIVSGDPAGRDSWFVSFLRTARGSDLVFFDPDNGVEVRSSPKVHKRSRKHVYWAELVRTYQAGHSLLVYQHFPRRPREAFIKEMKHAIRERTDAPTVYAFQTSHVAFLLLPRPEHLEQLIPLVETAKTK